MGSTLIQSEWHNRKQYEMAAWVIAMDVTVHLCVNHA